MTHLTPKNGPQPVDIFKDPEKKNKVEDNIELGISEAGKKTKKELWIENKLKFPINVKLTATGNEVNVVRQEEQIAPNSTKRVELEIEPNITSMEPVKAKLNVEVNYIRE